MLRLSTWVACALSAFVAFAAPDLARIGDVRIFRGTERVAYRDPAVLYADGTFHLFFTFIDEKNASIGLAWSDDLATWSWPGKKAVQ